MSLEEIVQEIPDEKMEDAWRRLVDLLLRSSKANRIPADLSKTILSHWQRDTLKSREGVRQLLVAAIYAEPEKSVSLVSEKLKLPGLAERLAEVERK
ncbi:MAG: hypothetical protein ACETV0_05075 [Nitrososphaeria archaeon]